MLALVVVWGVNFAIVKDTLAVLSPMAFNALRMAAGAVILLAVLRLTEGPLRLPRREWLTLLAVGIVGHTLYQTFFISGIARTTAGNSALILAMVPLFVALLGAALRLDALTSRTWGGILLAFGGLFVLIFAGGKLRLDARTLGGDALTLLCSICWASYTVFSRPFLTRMSPLRLTAVTLLLGVPPLVLISLPELLAQPWDRVTPGAWAGLGFSAVFAIALGYVVWYRSVQRVGGARTAVYSNLIPIVALAAAWLLLGERLSLLQIAGAAVVLAGVWIARTVKQEPAPGA
jgi:drug/metabolite transporter (DMT)-like permease